MTQSTEGLVYRMTRPSGAMNATIDLPTSKSICNRVLIIHALGGLSAPLSGISTADDSRSLQRLLTEMPPAMDVQNAGTVMRFLCAYFATKEGEFELKGSDRMHQRPIAPLVSALCQLGAQIDYLGNEGYPPIKIRGGNLRGGVVKLDGSISSQFISALMMIGPYLEGGLRIEFGEVASRSYLEMTRWVMQMFGVEVTMNDADVEIPPGRYEEVPFTVPADHSSAAYWVGMAAMRPDSEFYLKGLTLNDPQGDKVIFEILEPLIDVEQSEEVVIVRHKNGGVLATLSADLSSTPDLFPTLAFVCAGLGIKGDFSGLKSLPHKETDRLAAVKAELAVLGIQVHIQEGHRVQVLASEITPPVRAFKSYDDHRIVMSAAILNSVIDQVRIEDPEVVSKSYPTFWTDMERAGFKIEAIR